MGQHRHRVQRGHVEEVPKGAQARRTLVGVQPLADIPPHGVGGLNIDECRVGTDEQWQGRDLPNAKDGVTWGGDLNSRSSSSSSHELGRFPANTIHDGSDEVVRGFPETASGVAIRTNSGGNTFGGNNPKPPMENLGYDDGGGSASRFFYTAKASKKDRDEGLEEFESKQMYKDKQASRSLDIFVKRDEDGKPLNPPRKNIHPTVKPTDLMQYLIRLITPKGGTVLDPFMGSGSTGKAAMIENNERNTGYHFIGIDLEAEYCEIAKARILYGVDYREHKAREEEAKTVGKDQISLFDIMEDL